MSTMRQSVLATGPCGAHARACRRTVVRSPRLVCKGMMLTGSTVGVTIHDGEQIAVRCLPCVGFGLAHWNANADGYGGNIDLGRAVMMGSTCTASLTGSRERSGSAGERALRHGHS